MKYYAYTGTLSQISNGKDRVIVLHDILDDAKAPVMLECSNPALHDYLWRRSWTDDEERYINQMWIYNACLDLVAIVIPSVQPGRPAKIISQADPTRWSEAITIFGPKQLINTAKPEFMGWDEWQRWGDFREQHNIYGF